MKPTSMLASGACALVLACSDDPAPMGTSPADAGPRPDIEYTGPVKGGVIPQAPKRPADAPPPDDIDANIPVCATSFALPDTTNDESSAYVEGSLAELANGVVMTWSNDAWRALVSLPVGSIVHYRYRLTRAAEPDAGEDAGSATEYRTNAEIDAFTDAEGAAWNTLVVASCSDGGS
jgi:hypothetical protein